MTNVRIGEVAGTLLGPASESVLVTTHGRLSQARDADLAVVAEVATARGLQVLTFDLPGHGARGGRPEDCLVPDAAAELAAVWAWARDRYAHVRAFGTSYGAYLTLLTGADVVEEAWLLSPVLDMAALLRQILAQLGLTEEALRAAGRVEGPDGVLGWEEYAYVIGHPVDGWRVPTHVLRGAGDELTDLATAQAWCATGTALTTEPVAGHWFHTDADLAALRAWLERTMPPVAACGEGQKSGPPSRAE